MNEGLVLNPELDNPVTPILNRYRESLLTVDQLQYIPDPEWLIDKIIQKQTVNVLWGPSNGGKSFVAIDWAMSLATGKGYWFSNAVAKSRVLYIMGEGKRGMKQRVNSWIGQHRMLPEDEDIVFQTKMADIIEPDSFQATKQIVAETGAEFIVIDTLARAFTGHNENDTTEMGLFVAAAEEIRDEFNATILLVHHPATDKGAVTRMRGNTALHGAIDGEFELDYFELASIDEARTLKCRKQKDGQKFSDIEVYLRPQGDSLVASPFPSQVY